METDSCLPPQKPQEESLLAAIVSGFIAGVTATIAIIGLFKRKWAQFHRRALMGLLRLFFQLSSSYKITFFLF